MKKQLLTCTVHVILQDVLCTFHCRCTCPNALELETFANNTTWCACVPVRLMLSDDTIQGAHPPPPAPFLHTAVCNVQSRREGGRVMEHISAQHMSKNNSNCTDRYHFSPLSACARIHSCAGDSLEGPVQVESLQII